MQWILKCNIFLVPFFSEKCFPTCSKEDAVFHRNSIGDGLVFRYQRSQQQTRMRIVNCKFSDNWIIKYGTPDCRLIPLQLLVQTQFMPWFSWSNWIFYFHRLGRIKLHSLRIRLICSVFTSGHWNLRSMVHCLLHCGFWKLCFIVLWIK